MFTSGRVARLTGIVVVAVLLSGCWSQIGFGPEHRRHNDAETSLTPANAASLTEAWSVPIAGTASELVTSDGRLYTTVTGPDRVEVLAVDLVTGAEVWRQTLVDVSGADPKPTLTGVPVVLMDEMLMTGYASAAPGGSACDSRLVLLDPDTGVIAEVALGQIGSPVVSSGQIKVNTMRSFTTVGGACAPGPLQLLIDDPQNSEYHFTTVPGTSTTPVSLTAAPPTVVDGRILVANGSTLSAFPLVGCGEAGCTPTWSVDLGVPIDVAPPVGGESGQVFVAPTGGPLLALSAETGAELWRVDVGAEQKLGVAVADGLVFLSRSYAPGHGPTLPIIDAATGAHVGGTWVLRRDLTSAPTVAGGVLYRGTNGIVEAFDIAACLGASCPVLASGYTPAAVRAVSVARGRLFVAGDGYISAFAPT